MIPFIFKKILKSRNHHRDTRHEKSAKMGCCGRERSFRERLHDLDAFDWLAIISVLIMSSAVALAALCITADSNKSMQKQYAIFTLNTSRIGQNLKQDIDQNIMAIHIKPELEHLTALDNALVPTSTATTLITLAPRAPLDAVASVESKASHLKSSAENAIKSDASHGASLAHSAATSVESAAHSLASAAVGSVQSEAVKLVNSAFDHLIADFNLTDFYGVYLLKTCTGTYVTKNGSHDETPVNHANPPSNGTKIDERIDNCERHYDVDPITWMYAVYAAGAVATAVGLLLAIVGAFRKTRIWAVCNVVSAALGFCILGLATGVTQGTTVGAVKLTNLMGEYIGVAAYVGSSFFRISWAATALTLIDVLLWCIILRKRIKERYGFEVRRKSPAKRSFPPIGYPVLHPDHQPL